MVATTSPPPASVLEPTCGVGALLHAAAEVFPRSQLFGFDVAEAHLEAARAALAHTAATFVCADFFNVDWDDVVAKLPQPILVLGNPPWVTNAAVGALNGTNLPAKSNFKGDRGLEARTGRGNFDVSEWMLLRLLRALQGTHFTLAMLCKAGVARQVLLQSTGMKVAGALYEIDARVHFDATVDAVLLVLRSKERVQTVWPVYPSLTAAAPTRTLGMHDNALVNDVMLAKETAFLEGPSDLTWRSGLKHDCSAVMEWTQATGGWQNGLGEVVPLWDEGHLYPLCKGSHVAAGRGPNHRVLVTQTKLGQNTRELEQAAPHTWSYLQRHASRFAARKSRIYNGQPPFAMFGVGDYCFANFKVAICGLYKRLAFHVVGPHDGRPVMFDDTCYFLPCTSLEQAQSLTQALNGDLAQRFLRARLFVDSKRPVTKALLARLSLPRLLSHS